MNGDAAKPLNGGNGENGEMMKWWNIVLLFAAMLLIGCNDAPEITVRMKECAEMPSPRATAVACSLNGKGYVFSGRNQNGTYLKDLWEYDPATDQWKQITSFPGKARVSAAMTAYDGALYLGLGFAKGGVYTDSCRLHDWWRWEPSTDKWTKLASYEQATTVYPTLFVLGSRIYAIYGSAGNCTREINYYDTKTDSWHTTEDSHFRALSGFGCVGATCEGHNFFGLGFNLNNLKQWYTVDLESDDWVTLRFLPGKGRTFSACTASNHHIYIFGGRHFAGELTGGEVFSEMWQFTPSQNQWSRLGEMPCGRAENQIAFAIGDKVYFGLGADENGKVINKLYCIEE